MSIWYVSTTGSNSGAGTKTSPWAITTLATTTVPKPGDTIRLLAGKYGSGVETFTIRQNGASGSPIIIMPNPGDQVEIDCRQLAFQGSYTWLYNDTLCNLEVRCSTADLTGDPGTDLIRMQEEGNGNKLINVYEHDAAGVGVSPQSETADLEVNGCLICNSGRAPVFIGTGAAGHNIYPHGTTTVGQTRKIRGNVVWNAVDYGIHVFADTGNLTNLDIENNIALDNGLNMPGSGIIGFDYLIGGQTALTSLVFVKNVALRSNRQTTMSIGYLSDSDPGAKAVSGVATDNYAHGQVTVNHWDGAVLTFQRNTVVGTSGEVVKWSFQDVSPVTTSIAADNNSYATLDPDGFGPFALIKNLGLSATNYPDIASWRTATGFDLHSTLVTQENLGNFAFCFPSDYTPGRGTLAIDNPSGTATASADISPIVAVGAKFAIYSVFDLPSHSNPGATPVLTGTYVGGVVQVPMTGKTPQPVPGGIYTPNNGLPFLHAFLVVTTAAAPQAVPTPPAGGPTPPLLLNLPMTGPFKLVYTAANEDNNLDNRLANLAPPSGGGGTPGTPTVSITPTTVGLVVGQVQPGTITVLDGNGQPVIGALVTINAADGTVAAVEDTTGTGVPSLTTDSTGKANFLISGVGAGNTSLIAVSNGITSNLVNITVGGGTIALVLTPNSITTLVGSTTPIQAHLVDSLSQPMPGQTLNITINNPSIASVPASVVTDASGSAQIGVTGLAAGSAVVAVTPVISGITSTAAVAVQAAGAATPQITIGYTDYSTPYQSAAAAVRQMAFIASKTNHKWKLMNGLVPSGGYPPNVRQIPYMLVEQVKCYDGPANLLTQQAQDTISWVAANHIANPEGMYLHYIAGDPMMPDVILSIDGSGNATMKFDTETMAVVYSSAIGKTVTVAGNSNAALNGTWTVLNATSPAIAGGSAVVQLNTPAGVTGTGGTMQRTAIGNGTLPERFRTANSPFTPSWHINPASTDRKNYELDRLSRILATKYSGYGVFVDSVSNNVFPSAHPTLEYNPANSTQYHTDLAALFAALRATLGSGSWRYMINTGNYNDSGITQLISAAGSAHMESIITNHSAGYWPGVNQNFVATQLANGSAVEILNDVSVVDSELSFGAGLYINDPLPVSGNVHAMAYVIQSWICALMVWNGVDDQLAINLWNDLWINPSADLGGIDSKWLGMLDYPFGVPTAAATTLVSGVTDPAGQAVSIQTRAYGNNLVIYRGTSSGTTSWADTAGYVATLPASTGASGKWQRVKSDGTLDVAISTITLHPMMGAMLVPAGGSIALTPSSGSVKVGQAIPLTVTLLDASGNPVVNQLVTLTSSVPADATVPASVTTDSTGKATFNVTGVAVGGSNITAAANALTSSASVITVTSASTTTASDIFAADSITGVSGGGGIGTWVNDADNTRGAIQTNASLQPIFKTKILNNLPAVFYPSANIAQNLQYTVLAHTAWYIFIVAQKPTGTSSSHHGVLYATPGWRLQILDSVSNPVTIQLTSLRSGTNGVWQVTGVSITAGTIIQVGYDSTSTSNVPFVKINGVLQTVTQVTAPVGTQLSTAGNAYIGNDPTLGANDAYYGYIFEITLFDGALSSADESTEGRRLGTKWNIVNSY